MYCSWKKIVKGGLNLKAFVDKCKVNKPILNFAAKKIGNKTSKKMQKYQVYFCQSNSFKIKPAFSKWM